MSRIIVPVNSASGLRKRRLDDMRQFTNVASHVVIVIPLTGSRPKVWMVGHEI